MRFFKMPKKTHLIKIDFARSWLQVMAAQKWSFAAIYFTESASNAFLTIPALVLEWMFRSGRQDYFIYFVAAWLCFVFLEYIGEYYQTKAHTQSVQSVHYGAMHTILNVDPVYHFGNNKGTIIAKIYRGAEALSEALTMLAGEILQTFVGTVTVIITFLTIDIKLGLLVLGLLLLLSIVFTAIFMVTAHAMMPACLDADDTVKNVGTESLVQVSLIRSTFSGHKIDEKLRTVNERRLGIEATLWRSYYVIGSITKVLYVAIFCVTGFYVLSLISRGALLPTTGIALLLTFFNGTYQLLSVGQMVYRFKVYIDRINDLFEFMHLYGKQSFPVLERVAQPKLLTRQDVVSVQAKNITFKYSAQASIFSGHTLSLRLPIAQENKLYGIIGLSGQGKSTLLSILGGQLRPQVGSVYVDGLNIYTLNDSLRRGLIALQNQANASLYGSVKYNLTFGLPERTLYSSSDELIALLQKVGLWDWLNQKRGLETVVSEGGLTLSTGQRQRLSFLNLYLRARVYKPRLILIDEPTSALDDASEHIITDMIVELARQSLVLVVAHRLRTLEKTAGILDLSLLNESKEITVRSHEELARVSRYYQQLLVGNVPPTSSERFGNLTTKSIEPTVELM